MTPLMFAIGAFIGLATTMITAGISQYQADQQEELQKEANKIAETNVNNNLEIANKNFGLEQQQFEYQKQLNQLQMQREDTAMQRQVADLKAAGLSPLMASGGASTGQLISGTAPHMDMSGINSAISNLLGVKQDYASRKQMAYQFERQNHLQMAQQFADLTSLRLDNEYKKQLIEGQKIVNDYNSVHGARDPSLQQAIIDYVMKYVDEKGSVGDVIEGLKNDVPNIGKKANDALTDYIIDVAEDRIDMTKEMFKKATEVAENAYDKYIPESAKSKIHSGIDYVKNSRVGRYVGEKYNAAKNWVKKKLGK